MDIIWDNSGVIFQEFFRHSPTFWGSVEGHFPTFSITFCIILNNFPDIWQIQDVSQGRIGQPRDLPDWTGGHKEAASWTSFGTIRDSCSELFCGRSGTILGSLGTIWKHSGVSCGARGLKSTGVLLRNTCSSRNGSARWKFK